MTYSTYVVFVMQAPRVDLCELSLQSVSGTPAILGPAYDAPCELAASLYVNDSKRDIVEAALLRAKEARDDETVRLMHWELAMMDLLPVVQDGTSPCTAPLTSTTPRYIIWFLKRSHMRAIGRVRPTIYVFAYATWNSHLGGASRKLAARGSTYNANYSSLIVSTSMVAARVLPATHTPVCT